MPDLSSFINISANTIAGNTISTPAGNVSGNNVLTSGVVSAAGNVRGNNLNTVGNVTGNYFVGNGSQLTGLSVSSVSNGSSNFNVATANGNPTITSNGNTWTFGNVDVPNGLYWPDGSFQATAFVGSAQYLTNPGCVSVTTNSTGNTAYTWIFDSGGTLTVPGSITRPENDTLILVTSGNTGNSSSVSIDGEFGRTLIRTDDGTTLNTWQFDITGNLTLPDTTALLAAASITIEADSDGNTSGLYLNGDADANLYAHSNVTINSNVNGNSSTWTFGSGNTLTLPGSGSLIDSSDDNVEFRGLNNFNVEAAQIVNLYTNDGAHQWQFGDDGSLTAPGNISTTGNVTGNFFIGDGSLLTNLPASDYSNANVANYLPTYSGNIGTGNVTFTNNTIYSGTTITLPTTNGNLNKFSWNFRDLSIGSDTVSLEWNALTTTFGEFLIGTDSDATPHYFTFDGPSQTLGAIPGSGLTGGGKLTFGTATNNGAGNVDAIELTSSTSNVYVRANNNSWLFDTAGNLTIPNGILAQGVSSPAPVISGFSFNGDLRGQVSTTGNVLAGLVSASGNITGNFFIGNGSALTNIAIPSYGNAIAIGPGAGATSQSFNTVAIGANAAANTQGANGVAIGNGAGSNTQGIRGIAIGLSAGSNSQSLQAIAIGAFAGSDAQGLSSIAIGYTAAGITTPGESQGSQAIAIGTAAGFRGQRPNAIAVGQNAGYQTQGTDTVAIGRNAGQTSQSANAVAIGVSAGSSNQGANSIAIGALAGNASQANNTIVLNASGSAFGAVTANGFYVNPVRNDVNNLTTGNTVNFNWSTNELVAVNTISLGGNVSGANLVTAGLITATGNAIAGNIQTAGSITATGNVTAGNVRTAGLISAAGNVTAGNVYGNSITLKNTDDFAQVVFSNDGGVTNNGQIKVDGGTNMVVSSASNFYVKRAGSDRIAVTDTTADFMATTNVRIQSNKAGSAYTWTFDNAGNTSAPGNISAAGNVFGTNLTNKTTGSWTLATGTNTVSFTVPSSGTYSMWVAGNIPNGIIVWNATATVTNTNVPVLGQQFAWVYDGGGSPINFTSIPNQFIGTAGTIVSSNVAPSATTNVFEFGITNSSGSSQVINYGWVTIS
jgi:hypothetical protein